MLVTGTVIGVLSFLAAIVPLLALGLGMLFLGVMILFLPESASLRDDRIAVLSSLPSIMNVEALLEDLDINSRGIYLPTTGFTAVPKVLLPMTESTTILDSVNRLTSTNRVFVTTGLNPRDRGILLNPPGGEILVSLESALRLDLSTIRTGELETRLKLGFDMLGISKKTLVGVQGDIVTVEVTLAMMRQLEERLRATAPRVTEQIGTPLTSAIVSVISKATGRNVRFGESTLSGSKMIVNTQISGVEPP